MIYLFPPLIPKLAAIELTLELFLVYGQPDTYIFMYIGETQKQRLTEIKRYEIIWNENKLIQTPSGAFPLHFSLFTSHEPHFSVMWY